MTRLHDIGAATLLEIIEHRRAMVEGRGHQLRIENRAIRLGGVFQHLTGLPSYPDATTLRRFLVRVGPNTFRKLRALHDRLLSRMMLLPEPPLRVIFDVDSTVLVVYGKQEQARVGYNPIKRGRPSYHPLLCFEGQSRDFWHREGATLSGDVQRRAWLSTDRRSRDRALASVDDLAQCFT